MIRPGLIVVLLVSLMLWAAVSEASPSVSRWAPMMKREAQFIYGLDAPVPMLLGQIHQESGGRDQVTAWDGGMGLTQFMPETAKQIVRLYPELGPVSPYNPGWAIRAQVRYMDWIYDRVQGANDCERWAAGLKAYNAGLGYVQQAQRASPKPDIWFGTTEYVKTRQSAHNFEYSRTYPRKILFKHQPLYIQFGEPTCLKR